MIFRPQGLLRCVSSCWPTRRVRRPLASGDESKAPQAAEPVIDPAGGRRPSGFDGWYR